MEQIRIVAIPTKVAESVRATMLAPGYGFPAHSELGADPAPCRHCLRLITSGVERRVLFTYDRFAGGRVASVAWPRVYSRRALRTLPGECRVPR